MSTLDGLLLLLESTGAAAGASARLEKIITPANGMSFFMRNLLHALQRRLPKPCDTPVTVV
jgi:hypothetical protein